MTLLVYALILSVALVPVCHVIAGGKKGVSVNLYLIIMGVVLFALHAFKDWQGLPDLPTYQRHFELFREGMPFSKNSSHFETGYAFVVYLFAQVTHTVLPFSMFVSAIIIGGYMVMIRKYSPIPWISVFLMMCLPFLQSLFVIRQHMAVVICLFASWAIVHRKLWLFLLLTITAGLFHQSAFFFLPAYFIYAIPIDRTFWGKFLLVTLVAAVVLRSAMIFASSYLQVYDGYLTSVKASDTTNTTPMLISGVILLLTAMTIRVQLLDGFPKLGFLMTCATFLFELSGIGVPLIPRLVLYYSVYRIFFIPYLLSRQKQPDKIIYGAAICACFAALYFATLYNSYFDHYRVIL